MGKITRGVKGYLKSFVDVKSWIDFARVKAGFSAIKQMGKDLFVPAKATHTETFAESLQRLSLSESDIQLRIKQFNFLVIFYLICSVLLLIYWLYLIWHGHWRGALICTGVFLITASLCFRYHFWVFQLKKRKLGCSLSEWFFEGVLARTKVSYNEDNKK